MGVFLVTGAGSGIGQAIAARLTQENHQVFGVGRTTGKLESTAQMLPPDSFSFAAGDLSDPDESQRIIQAFREWKRERRFLGLVNNAGVFDQLSFKDSTDSIWQKHFEINLLSAIRLTRELSEDLKASAPSSVLNISSTLGLRPVALTSAYSAIKAAMLNWTETLALEWAPLKIRVNAICPGLIDTPIHSFHGEDESSQNRVQAHSAQPLGRMGLPSDVADAAWFLLSEKSSWTTGAVLKVDGGINL